MNDSHSGQPGSVTRVPSATILALALLVAGARSDAQVTLDATVTPLGGSFRYDLTIQNQGAQELALVSLTDVPLNDDLIEPNLVVPPGFLGSYDSLLGFVDFLADTSPFTPGGTFGGFSFLSYAGPGAFFGEFEALTIEGDSLSGSVGLTVVPEAGTLGAAASLLGLLTGVTLLRRRRQRRGETPGMASGLPSSGRIPQAA